MKNRQICLTIDEYHTDSEDGTGYCLNCGEPGGYCEPDAEKYKCENCGKLELYGVELLLVMGRIDLAD